MIGIRTLIARAMEDLRDPAKEAVKEPAVVPRTRCGRRPQAGPQPRARRTAATVRLGLGACAPRDPVRDTEPDILYANARASSQNEAPKIGAGCRTRGGLFVVAM
jgi:hypothetical protein